MSNPEFDSLYETAKYHKFGLDCDYIGDSVVKSSVVIAMYDELSVMTQRAEAAEARIKASQEQEPVAYVLSAEEAARTDGRTPVLYIGALPLGQKLYAAPVIPPDVAELQRENAELTLKLGEKQAEIDRLMLEHCPDEMTAEQIETWAKHQIPVDAKTQALIDRAAAPSKETDLDQEQRFK